MGFFAKLKTNLNNFKFKFIYLFYVKSNKKNKNFFDKIKLFLLKIINIDVFYINGSGGLPEPLSKEEEAKIFEKIVSGELKNREVLIIHNLRLVVYIAKKFEYSNQNIEDLISIGTFGLIKAVNTFCPDKNVKLATYASKCIENEILMYIRKISLSKNEMSIDEPFNVDADGSELLYSDILGSNLDTVSIGIEKESENKMLNDMVEKLSSRERVIMQMRYGLAGNKEFTQKEVANILKISQSYISRLERKIIFKLKRNLEKVY